MPPPRPLASAAPAALLALTLTFGGACGHVRAADPGASPQAAGQPLAGDAVYHDTLVAEVVYAWVDDQAVRAWARDHRLLTAARGRPDVPTRLAARVASHRIRTGSPLSALLEAPRLARRLAVWPNPWGASLGWRGERVGLQLARITLRREAVVGIFEAEREPAWSFVTAAGQPVTAEEVLARPERLAAVYHIDATEASHAYDPEVYQFRRDEGLPTHAHRELVLVDQALVATVEVGTDEARRALARSLEGLGALRRWLATAPAADPWRTWRGDVVDAIWPAPRPRVSPLSLYEAGLARPTRAYHPTAVRIAALIAALGGAGAAPAAPASAPGDRCCLRRGGRVINQLRTASSPPPEAVGRR